VNVIGDTAGCALSGPAVGDVISDDPLLEPLAENGGTMTHALQQGSPALDVAPLCPPPETDQRGIPRPQGDGCDVGAYELLLDFVWGDMDCSGAVTPEDAFPVLLFSEGLLGFGPAGGECPLPGDPLDSSDDPLLWGDLDCSGGVTPADILLILAFVAGVEADVDVPGGCPVVGEVLEFR
jgi:hypothetical protein